MAIKNRKKRITARISALLLSAAMLCSLSACSDPVAVTKIKGTPTEAGAAESTLLHSVGDKANLQQVGKSGLIELLFDESTYSVCVADLSHDDSEKLWSALPTQENSGAATATLEIVSGDTLYKLNTQDNSVSFQNAQCSFADDALSVTYILAPDTATAHKEKYDKDDIAFKLVVNYQIKDGSVYVSAKYENLVADSDAKLTKLSLLNFFGAYSEPQQGDYIFVPDGSGAIIRFNNGRVSQRAYYANLYGWDWASIRTQVTNETRINFPVFGVSGDSGSFICILEDGASWAGIGADIAGRLTSYNTVNATYTIVHGDAYDVSERTNNAVYMFETAHPTGFIRQRYRFLPESGYMDMAASYRDYLTAKYPNFAAQTVDAEAPLSIELIGAIDKVQQVAGVPTSVPIAMTTYAEAKDLLRELVTRNLAQNMSIRYAGWMNGGMNQQLLSSVRLIRQLGTQEELFSFAQNAAIAGVPLYLDGLTAFARDSGLLEGFIAFRDAARFTTREEAEIPEYSPIWYGANDDRDTYYLVKPAIAMRSVNTLVDAAASYGAGVSFRDIGYMLSADYDSKDHTTREAVLHQQAEKLAELKASGRDVMIRQGNDYAAVQATLITDMDFDGGQYSIIDEYVPFYPLALHSPRPPPSRVSYTGASLNLADDAEEVLLRSAEMGAGLQYTLTAQSARVLQDSTYSEFYGADASLVLDDITAQVAQYRETLSGIFNQEMTGHERVGNVTITTYANGTRVYVNFGYTDAAVNGITVPARSYAAQQGVSK